MNAATFNAVADLIEYTDRFNLAAFAARAGRPADDGWSLTPDQVWEDCTTTACVGGWVNVWADHSCLGDIDNAARELGITKAQAVRLFYAHVHSVWETQASHYGWDTRGSEAQITAVQAADVLRRIANGDIEL